MGRVGGTTPTTTTISSGGDGNSNNSDSSGSASVRAHASRASTAPRSEEKEHSAGSHAAVNEWSAEVEEVLINKVAFLLFLCCFLSDVLHQLLAEY